MSADARPTCYRCHKAQVTCICASVPLVHTRTQLWLVQHPRERFHPFGTARIARLGLPKLRMEVCWRPSASPPAELPEDAALLFPGAPDLGALPPASRPSTLVVIDGTWPHARKLLRDNAWLGALPRYGLDPPEPSHYRIRKEPRRECVSTIEAIVQALCLLEPDNAAILGLLGAFDAMIDQQIGIMEARAGA